MRLLPEVPSYFCSQNFDSVARLAFAPFFRQKMDKFFSDKSTQAECVRFAETHFSGPVEPVKYQYLKPTATPFLLELATR